MMSYQIVKKCDDMSIHLGGLTDIRGRNSAVHCYYK